MKARINYLKKHKIAIMLLIPSLIGLLLFFVIPLIVLLVYSFWDSPISCNFVGIQNYIDIFDSDAFMLALKNTFVFSLISVPLLIIISILLAMIVEEKSKINGILYSVILSPMVIPVASVSLVFLTFFDDKGFINGIINMLGGTDIPWLESSLTPLIILILYLWKNVGINMIMFMAAFSTIPIEYIEVARLETSSKWTVFWKIKIWHLLPTVVFVTFLAIISSFKIFREVYVLLGKSPYDSSYYFQHYVNNMLEQLEYSSVSAATMILLLIIGVIISLLIWGENRLGKDTYE